MGLVAFTFAHAGPVHASVYRYTDADGTVHFTNVPKPDARSSTAYFLTRAVRPGRASGSGGAAATERDSGLLRATTDLIRRALQRRHELDPALVKAVIAAESNFDPNGPVSREGRPGPDAADAPDRRGASAFATVYSAPVTTSTGRCALSARDARPLRGHEPRARGLQRRPDRGRSLPRRPARTGRPRST